MKIINLLETLSQKNKTESNYELRDLLEQNTINHVPESKYSIFNSDKPIL